MNKRYNLVLISIVIAVIGVFLYNVTRKPALPVIGENGRINGLYPLESIMAVGTPYRCTFSQFEGGTQMAGTVLTADKNVYGEFRIKTEAVKNEFTSFLILKNKKSYVWTSLYSIGYEAPEASSASTNASPRAQAQIIGKKDKKQYDCEPWKNSDTTVFNPPSWVTFTTVK